MTKYFDLTLSTGTYQVKKLPYRQQHKIFPICQALFQGALEIVQDREILDKIFLEVENKGLEATLKEVGIDADSKDFQRQLDQFVLTKLREDAYQQNSLKYFLGALDSKQRLEILDVCEGLIGRFSTKANVFVPLGEDEREEVLGNIADSETFLVSCISNNFGSFFLKDSARVYKGLFAPLGT